MLRINKEIAYHGMMNLVFIILAIRQSGMNIFSSPNRDISFYEGSDGGPILVAPAALPTNLIGHPRKSFSPVYDSIMDEYDRIMQDARSHSPVMQVSDTRPLSQENTITTMVLGMPDPSGPLMHGGLRVSRHPVDGAVGGFGQPFLNDENLDIFNNFLPGNMREDEINDLLSRPQDGAPLLDQSFPDIDWQRVMAEYDQFVHGATGVTKSVDTAPTDWSTPDLVSQAIQSSELFLPMPSGSQNASDFHPSNTDTSTTDHPMAAARLDMMEYSEWASQNHQDDLLFPSLPPPSYEQVVQSDRANTTSAEPSLIVSTINHLHDHNYCNMSRPQPEVEESSAVTHTASYAIRSRHEVSTRVISIPPRPRHISSGAESSSSSTVDEATASQEETSVDRFFSNRNTASSEGSIEIVDQSNTFDSFIIKPLNLTYFDNISKTVGARREVVLCN